MTTTIPIAIKTGIAIIALLIGLGSINGIFLEFR
jgi:hypothetical protein